MIVQGSTFHPLSIRYGRRAAEPEIDVSSPCFAEAYTCPAFLSFLHRALRPLPIASDQYPGLSSPSYLPGKGWS